MSDTTKGDDSTASGKSLSETVANWFVALLDAAASLWASASQLAQSAADQSLRAWVWAATVPARIRQFFQTLRSRYRDWKTRRQKRRETKESLAEQMFGDRLESGGEEEEIKKTLDAVADRIVERSPVGVAGPGAGEKSQQTTERVTALQGALTAATEALPGSGDWPVADSEGSREGSSRESAQRITDKAIGFPSHDSNGTTIEVTSPEVEDAEALTDATILPVRYRGERQYTDTTIRGYWEKNPNAEEKLQQVMRTPIVDRHFRTIIEHLITSRPKIKGPEEQADAARWWFEVQVELNSQHERGLNRFISDIAGQMLRYGSAAVIKQRTRSQQGEKYTEPMRGRQRSPVSSYMVPDMSTVEVFMDKKARPRKWRQDPELHTKHDPVEYPDRDVFLAEMPARNSAMYFWTPSLVSLSLYPIEVLRDLHETIEQHTKNIIDIPNYARVGDKNYLDGQVNEEMLRRISRVIERTPRGSMPVLPWFVELAQQESDEYVEQLTDAAEFWEKEVRRGVGGSKLQDGIGDSGTRNTSEVLVSKEMRTAQSLVPEIQRVFRWIISDVLLQRGVLDLDEVNGHTDMVSLEFEDIDMHAQIRREEHYIHAFQNEAYKHGEFRTLMGRDIDPERQDQYFSDLKPKEAGTEAESQSRNRPGGSPRPKNKNE